MNLFLYFLVGMFTFNSVPHLVKGIAGASHMTPFKRVSSPLLNVIWAFSNLIVAAYLAGLASGLGQLVLPWVINPGSTTNTLSYLAGAFIMSCADAWLFGNPNARLPWHKD